MTLLSRAGNCGSKCILVQRKIQTVLSNAYQIYFIIKFFGEKKAGSLNKSQMKKKLVSLYLVVVGILFLIHKIKNLKYYLQGCVKTAVCSNNCSFQQYTLMGVHPKFTLHQRTANQLSQERGEIYPEKYSHPKWGFYIMPVSIYFLLWNRKYQFYFLKETSISALPVPAFPVLVDWYRSDLWIYSWMSLS